MSTTNSTRRVVPWLNRSEFVSVYEGAYSSDLDKKQFAVDRIAVWKSRVMYKLPVAIDSTDYLCRACIHHQQARNNGQMNTLHHQICNEYCMAIIRFVNHITEKGQNRPYALPVHMVASEFGLPEWIVEIRHSATHGNIPSLNMLCAGTDWALDWLKEEFWEKQLESMPVNRRTPENGDPKITNVTIHQALQVYEQKMTANLHNEFVSCDKEVRKLEQLFSSNRSVALRCLLEDGHLMSTRGQLEELKLDLDGCLTSDTLPIDLVALWKPVIKTVHHLHQTALLLKYMVSMVTEHLTLKNWLICGWMMNIISANESAAKNKKKSRKLYYKTKAQLPMKLLLTYLIKVPSVYTAPVIRLLLNKQHPPLETTKIEKLTRLIDVYTSPLSSEERTRVNVRTLHDLPSESSRDQLEETVTGLEVQKSPWKLCNHIVDWSLYPIGSIPTSEVYNDDGDWQTQDDTEMNITEDDLICGDLPVEGNKEREQWTPTENANIKKLVCVL